MKTYNVRVYQTIDITYQIEAEDEDHAIYYIQNGDGDFENPAEGPEDVEIDVIDVWEVDDGA